MQLKKHTILITLVAIILVFGSMILYEPAETNELTGQGFWDFLRLGGGSDANIVEDQREFPLAAGERCRTNRQCASEKCTNRRCLGREAGSPCDSSKVCSSNICIGERCLAEGVEIPEDPPIVEPIFEVDPPILLGPPTQVIPQEICINSKVWRDTGTFCSQITREHTLPPGSRMSQEPIELGQPDLAQADTTPGSAFGFLGAFTGLAVGSPCSQHGDCPSSEHCNNNGVCAPDKRGIQFCEDGQECLSGSCNTEINQCRCFHDQQCPGGMSCQNNQCIDRETRTGSGLARGASCTSDQNCSGSMGCGNDGLCGGTNALCGSALDCLSQNCPNALNPSSRCGAITRSVGESCTANDQCVSYSNSLRTRCVNGICGGEGASCRVSQNCNHCDGLRCVSGSCQRTEESCMCATSANCIGGKVCHLGNCMNPDDVPSFTGSGSTGGGIEVPIGEQPTEIPEDPPILLEIEYDPIILHPAETERFTELIHENICVNNKKYRQTAEAC